MTKTIILACVGGLTTSMLVERINEVIHRDQLNYSFYSVGIAGINNLRELYTSLHQLQDIVFPIISKKTTSFRKSSFIVRCSLKRAGI